MRELTEVGKILEAYRKSDEISLRTQASKIGLSFSYLSDISHGNRGMTVPVLKKIVTCYKYRCVGKDFITLATACFDSEVFRRYKIRTHNVDDNVAIRDLIFILTGEQL